MEPVKHIIISIQDINTEIEIHTKNGKTEMVIDNYCEERKKAISEIYKNYVSRGMKVYTVKKIKQNEKKRFLIKW